MHKLFFGKQATLAAPNLWRRAISAQQIKGAFGVEMAAVDLHSTLVNQTSPEGLAQLADIKKLMAAYGQLHDNGALLPRTMESVVNALGRSAKDCSTILRSLPSRSKQKVTADVFSRLKECCDQVAADIIAGTAPRSARTMGTLLSCYELVDPAGGVEFYKNAEAVEVTGSVIPCMVKAEIPLDVIEQAYNVSTVKHPRLMAAMVWAYLVNDEPEKALDLYKEIDQNQPSVRTYLLNVFVGDAPAELGTVFFENAHTAPHAMAMTRYLSRLWEQDPNVDRQLHAFQKYLELARGASEAQIKTLTYQVVGNVLDTDAINETVHENIEKLVTIYRTLPRHTVFLNILLTQITNKWPNANDLAVAIMKSYGAEGDPVSFRVRLNACEGLDFPEKTKLIERLWEARCSLAEPLRAYDWMALGRADKFGRFFEAEWEPKRPFERDVRNFRRAHGI